MNSIERAMRMGSAGVEGCAAMWKDYVPLLVLSTLTTILELEKRLWIIYLQTLMRTLHGLSYYSRKKLLGATFCS